MKLPYVAEDIPRPVRAADRHGDVLEVSGAGTGAGMQQITTTPSRNLG